MTKEGDPIAPAEAEHELHSNKTDPAAQVDQTDGNASFLRAARAGNLEKVLEYLKGSIDINTSNANGLNALHLASKEGHVNVVTELLRRGANVDAATKKGNTALHIASLAGQEEIVKILVQNGALVDVQSQNGFTPLYMAAQENHDNVVKFLLANNANQSLATEDGFTPLAVALQQGHDKVVAVLLENDTRGKVRLPALHIAAKKDDCKAAALLLQNDRNPDVTSKSGFTPLHIAAHYGNENIANLLLQRGADINYAAKHHITPLHVASKWGKTNMLTLLVEKGGNVDAKTRDGLTPLHCAARSGHDQVVDLLLERGAPIVAKTKNGLAPLHMAAQGDHVDSARILLYHKAPVDDVTVDYLTALHVAAHCGHVRVAKLLLDRKADPNARALNGFTPLHIACKKNRIKVVELLLKHGASIEATTESGLTPLHVASFMGSMNIVIYLIQHGSNPDVPTVRGETPLHLAARANQTDIIRILLRNGAHVDARAREQQTPLHIAARLGNSDIVALLLQHGASVDATTKDMYTALHIAAKEGQEEVASVLLEHGASLTATTKKGFTPLHLAAKYGNMKVARLLLQRDAPVDAQGKNGVTPLHVAAHYDNQNVALLLLDKGASPHATAKNGYTPLHIAAKKNQMDIATTLLEYGAKANAESKAGFTPLHLAAQEGHTDMSTLLIEHHADINAKAKNGLTPLHLCAQEDKVNVAAILVKSGAEIDSKTKAGYMPLHVACHFGQMNMVRFLLQHGADVNATTVVGYTPLHQASQQGHTQIVNLLLENRASPNAVTNQGQTALSIAQRLGYISVVETLKIVTETVVTTTTTTVTEEKYRVVAPETMQETFMSDSEDEGGEDTMLGDQSYRYLTVDEMKSLGDDSLPIDPTRDERIEPPMIRETLLAVPPTAEEDELSPQPGQGYAQFTGNYAPDNIDISSSPIHAGMKLTSFHRFLVSFMVDARGGAMRGCRHSGVRVIIPPRKAPMPMRITCRYLKKEKLAHPPPLMEGEACASRILEMGPTAAKFLGPVIIEVPHFASLRGKEREITILRSDNGETWREHTLEASEEAVQEVLNESFDGEELSALEDLNTNRITRILTTDFPQYFAIITRIRQEVHAIGPEGGMVSSTVVPQVQAVFPEGALTKKIKVGLQAQPVPADLVAKMLGNRVAVSPVVTVEPRRRKFHKPITLTIPVPQAAARGMINQYSGETPTLRLLCSITGGITRAQWEDVTGSTPLTFVNDCVSFTTTVSARFWLMDCRNISEATKMATELYREAIHVPFMAKFVVFAKRQEPLESKLRVFCMTDDKEDKTLENQEHFIEVAKSRDVEVLEAKYQYVEFAGNLVPVTKSGEQLSLNFHAFRENRLPFITRVKDPNQESIGRIAFMREAKVGRGDPPQTPICNLNITLPDVHKPELSTPEVVDVLTLEKRYAYLKEMGLSKPETIHKADLRLSDIAQRLGNDWVVLALQLDMPESDINLIKTEYPDDVKQQAMVMLRLWMQVAGNKATGNTLEKALRKINREDIVNQCIFNVELVTDDVEKAVAKVHLDQSGFDMLKEELGPSRDTSLRRDMSLDASYDEQDIMKEAESAEETSSETGSVTEKMRTEVINIGSAKEVKEAEADVETSPDKEPSVKKSIEEKEWVEEVEGGVIKHKVKVTTQTFDGKVTRTSDGEESDKAEARAGATEGIPESKETRKEQESPIVEEEDARVIEETVPFSERKDFFQKLVDGNTTETSITSEKISVEKISKEDLTPFSPEKPIPAESSKGEVIEEVAPFAERVQFFRKSLEESSIMKDISELKMAADSKSRPERPPPPSELKSSSKKQPPVPPKPSPPYGTQKALKKSPEVPPKPSSSSSQLSSKFDSEMQLESPQPPPRKSKQLPLKTTPDEKEVGDISPFTPDLETPKDTPEMASKSDEQKMIMVTERVVEAATSLASSLEEAEKQLTSPRKGLDGSSVEAPTDSETIKKIEEEITSVLTDVENEERKLEEAASAEEKWKEVDSKIDEAFRDAQKLESELTRESSDSFEFVKLKPTNLKQTTADIVDTASESDEGKAVKAEIKLLVKTTELGKEAIEIRSIKEFMDLGDKKDVPKIFSGAMSPVTSPTPDKLTSPVLGTGSRDDVDHDTDNVLRSDLQDKEMEERICPFPTKQSLPQHTIVVKDVESPLSKPSPLEPPSASVEEEISPAVEYPLRLTAEHQVHVGVSPTEDSLAVQQARKSTSSEQTTTVKEEAASQANIDIVSKAIVSVEEVIIKETVKLSETDVKEDDFQMEADSDPQRPMHMGFENEAFAGVEEIDVTSKKEKAEPADISPFEVNRSELAKQLEGYDTMESVTFASKSVVDTDTETLFKAHILKDAMCESSEKSSPEQKHISLTDDDISTHLDKQIKQTMLNSELEEVGEPSSFEEKSLQPGSPLQPDIFSLDKDEKLTKQIHAEMITHELQEAIDSGSLEEKGILSQTSDMKQKGEQFVVQRMKSEIIAQELSESPYAQSPEVKALSYTMQKSDGDGGEVISQAEFTTVIKSASEHAPEPIVWETSVLQQQRESEIKEITCEIPAVKQTIIEKDEVCSDDRQEYAQDTIQPTEETESVDVPKSSGPGRIRSTLRHIPSEISEEDLEERFGTSPDKGPEDIELQHDVFQRPPLSKDNVSSIYISDEDLKETPADISLDDLNLESVSSEKAIEETLKIKEELFSQTKIVTHAELPVETECKKDSICIQKEESSETVTDKVCLSKISESECRVVESSSDESFAKTHDKEFPASTSHKEEAGLITKEIISTTDSETDNEPLLHESKPRIQKKYEYIQTISEEKQFPEVSETVNGTVIVRTIRTTVKHEEIGSSSGESPFYSCETDSGQTSRSTPRASRPCSSDVEAVIAGTTGSSEYETCLTSQEASSGTTTMSQEFRSAAATLSHSSRESMRSIDSDSSGHLGSFEVSSETSETLVPSALEMERDVETPVIDDEKYFAHDARVPLDTTTEKSPGRIYDLPGTSTKLGEFKKFSRDGEVKYEELEEPTSPFEIVSESEIVECAGEQEISQKEHGHEAVTHSSIEKTNTLYADFRIRHAAASPDTDDTSTDYHSASEGRAVQLTPQHSESSLTDYDQCAATSTDRIRAGTHRQESGAYMPGDKVDDIPAPDGRRSVSVHPMSDSQQLEQFLDVRASQDTSALEITSSTSQSLFTQDASLFMLSSTASSHFVPEHSPSIRDEPKSTQMSEHPEKFYSHANGPVETEFNPEYDAEKKPEAHLRRPAEVTTTEDVEITEEAASKDESKRLQKKKSKSQCKEDKDDEQKEEDESEDKDEAKDIGDMQESEVLFGEQALECPRVVTSAEAKKESSDDEMSGDESETEVQHEQLDDHSQPTHLQEDQGRNERTSAGEETFHHDLETDRPESELKDLDSSRPHSHAESVYSRSDSDQRPYSELQFSDDRPESELIELMRQPCDIKETVDEIERPLSPEPKDEYLIKDDDAEDGFAEVVATVKELEEEYGLVHGAEKVESSNLIVKQEKYEFETRQSLIEESNADVPDITVTRCLTPAKDQIATGKETDSIKPTPELTPSTEGSDKASDSASSQEYILDRGGIEETISGQDIETCESFILLEKAKFSSEESPDSFEMKLTLEKRVKEKLPDVCAIAKEPIADVHLPQDIEVTGITNLPYSLSRIEESGAVTRPKPSEPIPIVHSACSTKSSEDNGSFPESFESEKGSRESQESFKYIRDTDSDSNNWTEDQSKNDDKNSRLISNYGYQMNFEKNYEGEMYVHDEALEDIMEEAEKQDEEEEEKDDKDSNNFKSSTRSTPDFDILAGRKYFGKSGEHDDVSMSSLQEFERLEAEIGHDRRSSLGSQDSLNGRRANNRSVQGDDVSISSLQEFETLEQEITETETTTESAPQEQPVRLSEIEEGHESQISESESQETLSEQAPEEESDADDYEQRMIEIDEIIKQAQSNVEQFETTVEKHKHETMTEVKSKQDSGSGGSGEITESSLLDRTSCDVEDHDVDSLDGDIKDLDDYVPSNLSEIAAKLEKDSSQSTKTQSMILTSEVISHSHTERSSSIPIQYDAKSLKERSCDSEEASPPEDDQNECDEDSLQKDSGSASIVRGRSSDHDADSLQGDSKTETKDVDSDSLKDVVTTDSAIVEGSPPDKETDLTDLDILGKKNQSDIMISSTDSLEPSSSMATHATYQYETDSIMSSSFASVQTSEESTMISSTETLDPEQQLFRPVAEPRLLLEDVRNIFADKEVKNYQYVDAEGNVRTTETDSEGNINTFQLIKGQLTEDTTFSPPVKQTVMMKPEVRTVTFAGPNAEDQMKKFIEKFQPGQDVVEMETTDEQGNIKVVRTVQHRVIMQPQMTTVKFSGPDAEEKLQDFMSQAKQEFQTADDEDIVETVDDDGTIHRVIRRRIIQPDVQTMTFSGPDARIQMANFMKQTLPDFDPNGDEAEMDYTDSTGNLTRITKHSIVRDVPKTYTTVMHESQEIPSSEIMQKTDGLSQATPDVVRHTQMSVLSSASPSLTPHLPGKESSVPSSPTHSTSSHSEDCYCGPEADASALSDPQGIRHTDEQLDQQQLTTDGQTRSTRKVVHTVTTVGSDGQKKQTSETFETSDEQTHEVKRDI